MKKRTEELMRMLEKNQNIVDFINDNNEEFSVTTLPEHLAWLLFQYNIKKSDVINRSGLNQIYAYQIFAGTKGYAAPEQYGFSQTDNRSDIYSLGVMIKELLGSSLNTVAYKNVIEKCTQVDPNNRYQTAGSLWKPLTKKRLRYSTT